MSRVDWGAHFGGFVFGLIACALIDLLEKGTSFVLRCKFPEFVKVNAFVILGIVALIVSMDRPMAAAPGDAGWELPVGLALAACAVVKACDLVLSIRHGLAILVAAFAVANAAFAWLAGDALAERSACVFRAVPRAGSLANAVVGAACDNLGVVLVVGAVASGALTLLICAQELQRGIADVGFVGATLRAERKRRYGL